MSTLRQQTSQNNYKIITFCNTNIYKTKKRMPFLLIYLHIIIKRSNFAPIII